MTGTIDAVELFVDGRKFDPKAFSMTGVQTVLRLTDKCAIVDYDTHDLIGYFVRTESNPWGFAWIKAQTHRVASSCA